MLFYNIFLGKKKLKNVWRNKNKSYLCIVFEAQNIVLLFNLKTK